MTHTPPYGSVTIGATPSSWVAVVMDDPAPPPAMLSHSY